MVEADRADRSTLVDRLEQAERHVRRQALRNAPEGMLPVNLTIQQLRFLLFLWVEGEHSARELADALDMKLTTLTGMVDRLETRGLVCRRPDPADRRVRRIALTEEGAELVAQVEEVGRARKRRVYQRLDTATLANLADGVEALARALDEEIAECG